MEYKEYEFRVNDSVSYDYFADTALLFNTDDCVTLGFKHNKPVLRKKQIPRAVTSAQIENQARIQVNPQATPNCNDKKTFIYINGKKVCVVPTKLNVVPMKFSLTPPITKCIGQPVFVTKDHPDQQPLNLTSPLSFSVLKPQVRPVTNVKCEQTVVKMADTENVNGRVENDSKHCDPDTHSDSVSNSSPEAEGPDVVAFRSLNPSIRTYSRYPAKKTEDTASDVTQSSSSAIDYERRVMTNIRTYKMRKSVSTSCEDLNNSVAVSTQTVDTTKKAVATVETSTQTEDDLYIKDDFLNSLCFDNSNEAINFASLVNSSTCPTPAVSCDSHSDKIMQQFYYDFKDCMNYNSKGNLPIHEGVLANDIKLVKRNCVVLQAKQEGVNILNHENLSPLQLAILNETREDVIELLLSYGADLGAMDTEGNNVLHLAIENGRRKALEIMMKFAKKNDFDIDTFNYEGLSPLMLCCINGSHDLARLLLANGAKPNLRDLKSGRTALFHASESHDVDMIKLLLKYKADTKIRNFFGTSPHDAMFEVDDIPEGIKMLILGKDTHVRVQQKKRSRGHVSKMVAKRKKYASKTLNVISSIQRIDILNKPT